MWCYGVVGLVVDNEGERRVIIDGEGGREGREKTEKGDERGEEERNN